MKKTLTALINKRITSDEELFQVFYEELDLPGWFGFNWDALWDCLNSFEDDEFDRVSIVIESWPSINAESLAVFKGMIDDLDDDIVHISLPQPS